MRKFFFVLTVFFVCSNFILAQVPLRRPNLKSGAKPVVSKPKETKEQKMSTGTSSKLSKRKKTFEDGGIYEGDMMGGKAHGYGKCVQLDGTVMEGEWKNDEPNGQVTIVFYNGDKYIGKTKGSKKLNGEGTYYTKDGFVYKGTFVDGYMKKGEITDTNDPKWKYEGELDEEGFYHGFGTLADANGVYVGTWEKGNRIKGNLKSVDGGGYNGEWKNNGPHGYGILTYTDGTVYQGYFQDGMKHGTGSEKGSNGSTFTGEWQYDKQYTGTLTGIQETPFGKGNVTVNLKEGAPCGTLYMNIGEAFIIGKLSGSGFDGDFTLTKDGQVMGFKIRNGQMIQE